MSGLATSPILCFAVFCCASISDWSRVMRLNRAHGWKALIRSSLIKLTATAAAAAAAPYDIVADEFHDRVRGDRPLPYLHRYPSSVLSNNLCFVIATEAVIAMFSITSFISVNPDVFLYAVTLLCRMSEGKRWCFTPTLCYMHVLFVIPLIACCFYLVLNVVISEYFFLIWLSFGFVYFQRFFACGKQRFYQPSTSFLNLIKIK